MSIPTHCFYVPGSTSIIDVVRDDGRSSVYGHTLEEVRAREPDAELRDLDEVAPIIQEAMRAKCAFPPKRTTEERFTEMLEIMPPDGWVIRGSTQTFKLCERTVGTLTAIFAKIGDNYFELCDEATVSHEAILRMCVEAPL